MSVTTPFFLSYPPLRGCLWSFWQDHLLPHSCLMEALPGGGSHHLGCLLFYSIPSWGHWPHFYPDSPSSHLSSKNSLHLFTQVAYKSLNPIFFLFLQTVPSTFLCHFTCHLHRCLSQGGDISLDSSFFLSLLIQPSYPINSLPYKFPHKAPCQCLKTSSLPWVTSKTLQTVLPTSSVAPTLGKHTFQTAGTFYSTKQVVLPPHLLRSGQSPSCSFCSSSKLIS